MPYNPVPKIKAAILKIRNNGDQAVNYRDLTTALIVETGAIREETLNNYVDIAIRLKLIKQGPVRMSEKLVYTILPEKEWLV